MNKAFDAFSNNAIKGLIAFNAREFYPAHEYFESAWRETPHESRILYRALLDLSGGFFRLAQNRPDAAWKFFVKALNWLEQLPSLCCGLDLAKIILNIRSILAALDQKMDPDTILQKFFEPIPPPEGCSR